MKALQFLLLAFLLFLEGEPAGAQVDENTAIEFNVDDFVFLEVGNQWNLVHTYRNEMYVRWPIFLDWDGGGGEYWAEEEAGFYEVYFSPIQGAWGYSAWKVPRLH